MSAPVPLCRPYKAIWCQTPEWLALPVHRPTHPDFRGLVVPWPAQVLVPELDRVIIDRMYSAVAENRDWEEIPPSLRPFPCDGPGAPTMIPPGR